MNAPASRPAEDDIQLALPPTAAKLGGGAMIAAGALTMLVAVQTITGFWVRSDFQIGLGILAALGLAELVVGFALMRARAWAAIAGAALSAALFLGGAAWLFLSLRSGLLSLFGLGAPPVAFTAIALSAVAIGPCRRVAAARARLAAQGLDMGT
jgi:hypothetical protein